MQIIITNKINKKRTQIIKNEKKINKKEKVKTEKKSHAKQLPSKNSPT